MAAQNKPDASASRGLPVRRFSTDGIEPQLRHAAWAAQGWPSLAPALETEADAGFEANSMQIGVGPLTVIYGRYGSQWVRRSRDRIRRAPAEHLNIGLLLSGRIEGSWGRLAPGEIGLADMTTEFRHHSSRGALVTLAVPRPLAHEHGLDPRALHGARIGIGEAALLRAHLLQIRRSAELLRAADAPRLAGTIVDLLAVSLAAAGHLSGAAPRAASLAVKERAEQLIAGGVADPRLDAGYLSGALGVSRATLYRLFAAEGGVARRIREVRLAAAATALEDDDATVAEVGERFGFVDPAGFSRAFRDRHGVSPSDWRAGGRTG